MARVFRHEPPKPGANKKAGGPKETKKGTGKGKTTNNTANNTAGTPQDGEEGSKE